MEYTSPFFEIVTPVSADLLSSSNSVVVTPGGSSGGIGFPMIPH